MPRQWQDFTLHVPLPFPGLQQACPRCRTLSNAIVASGSRIMADVNPKLACICLLQVACMSCLLLPPPQTSRQLGLCHPDCQLSV